MSDEPTYGMVLPFDTDDPEFARGCEVGMLWEALKHNPHRHRVQLRGATAEMALRISEATGRTLSVLSDVDDWLDVEFGEGIDD